jgi:outer membrane protein assembly factor BamB
MPNKFIIFLTFIFLLSCSKDETVHQSNYINIFQPKNEISFVNKEDRENSKLDNLSNLQEILNSKSYNSTNSKINFPFKKKWQIDTDQYIDDKNPYLPDPLYYASYIYLLNINGYLFKINSTDGKIVWKKQIFNDLEDTIVGTPAIAGIKNKNNTVTLYAHNGSRELLAINGVDGTVIWEKKNELPFRGGITSYKNYLFVSDFDGNFLSFNNRNGKLVWNVFLGSEYNSVYTTARPLVVKNKVIVPGTGGTFFVIAINTGEVLWSENISSNKQLPILFHSGDIVANPIYYKGKLFLVSQSGFTAAFNLKTSKKIWDIPIGGFETPTISGKTIFIMGNLGILAAVDTDTGKLRWKKQYPSYVNEKSFFSEKEISVYKGPTLVDSKLLITNQKGIIKIVNANNGSEIDTLNLDELSVPPIPVDGNLLFLTAKGSLLAF